MEDKTTVHILTDGVIDDIYLVNRILAIGTVDELKEYIEQLESANIKGKYAIEERDNTTWDTRMRYKLVRHKGKLYTSSRLNKAITEIKNEVRKLKDVASTLEGLKETVSEVELEHIKCVLCIIENKIRDTDNREIELGVVS